MKVSLLSRLLIAAGLLAGAELRAENSIGQLPQLGALLVKSYECRTALLLTSPELVKEARFSFRPSSGTGVKTENLLQAGEHEVLATADAKSLQIQWKRAGAPVATAMAMIQKSSTKAFVLMALDPANPENQVTLDCSAVNFRTGASR